MTFRVLDPTPEKAPPVGTGESAPRRTTFAHLDSPTLRPKTAACEAWEPAANRCVEEHISSQPH